MRILLADEINEAPAKFKVHFWNMQEKQVTIGDETFSFETFLVWHQTLWEQEGLPLPEAQVDRFMLKVVVDYPSKDERNFNYEKE